MGAQLQRGALQGMDRGGLGGLGLFMSRDLDMGSLSQMGPGFLPRVVGWLLIFGEGGAPRLGIVGVGWATVATSIASVTANTPVAEP